jgi:RHS repeat-associated protein
MFLSTKNTTPFWYSQNVIVGVNLSYPFGSILSSVSKGVYRYGFNGHEKDEEVKGNGNYMAFGEYGYDSRLGRRYNIDPFYKQFCGLSSYSILSNSPIQFIDTDGKKMRVAKNNINEIEGYLSQLGLQTAIKISKNGSFKLNSKWEKNNKNILNENTDLKTVYDGLKFVIKNKQKIIYIEVKEQNYDNIRTYQQMKTETFEEEIVNEFGIKEKITREKQVPLGLVDIVGEKNVSVSKTFYFGDRDPNIIDVFLHKGDMQNPTDALNGGCAEPSEAATFIHEILDHGMEFMKHGKELDDNTSNPTSHVKIENSARRVLKLKERAGTDHQAN